MLSVASYDMTRSQDLDYNRDYVPSQRNHANKPRNRGQRAQTNPETVKIKIISMTTSKPRRHRTPVPPSHSAGCQKNKEACTLPSPRSPEERAGSHRGAQRSHDFGTPVSFGGEKKLVQKIKKKYKKRQKKARQNMQRKTNISESRSSLRPFPPFPTHSPGPGRQKKIAHGPAASTGITENCEMLSSAPMGRRRTLSF